ncbi:murein transglycosylase A [Neomegalonema perideroedes]|uniref:murein transglycosylase A n=1 Tax=Neomegalonema perideroedes TaxID=217219 RepID=UPI000377F5BC|nr:MltA domain-containing protein [Neomegalonema perideroedes]
MIRFARAVACATALSALSACASGPKTPLAVAPTPLAPAASPISPPPPQAAGPVLTPMPGGGALLPPMVAQAPRPPAAPGPAGPQPPAAPGLPPGAYTPQAMQFPPQPVAGPEFVLEGAAGRAQPVQFAGLQGWAEDDHAAALNALAAVCQKLSGREVSASIGGPKAADGAPIGGYAGDWVQICGAWPRDPRNRAEARAFFEHWFQPVRIEAKAADEALFTGYYEPELRGSLTPVGPYQFPLYRKPDDLIDGVAYHNRAQIDAGALKGRGLELVFVDDPVDLFFLHIQGSGRVRLPDGNVMRVGYAGKNGHSYKSIGRVLADRGEMTLGETSADGIKAWARRNPQKMWGLFAENPSYVFFTPKESLSPNEGPVGSFGTPLPALRSVAVDQKFYALGLPIWIETDSPAGALRRLVVALDTGGAIKGAQRADIFFGSGDEPGRLAGSTKDYGRMTALLPKLSVQRIWQGAVPRI